MDASGVGGVGGAHAGVTASELMLNALRRHGPRRCLTSSGITWSYRQLAGEVAAYCRRINQAGVEPRGGIAILSRNRPEVLAVMLAALIGGYRYTSLHPLGSFEDHAFILQDAEIQLLVFGPEQLERAGRLCKEGRVAQTLAIGNVDPTPDESAVPQPPLFPHGELELAWLVYTGGTTGRPKGVMLPHRVIVQNILMTLAEWDWPEEIRFLAVTPLSHAAGLIALSVFVRGGSVCVLPLADPALVLRRIAEERITATFVVPSLLYRLLDEPSLSTADIGSLKLVIYGASPISPERLREALNRFGPIFQQAYGQAEVPNTATILRKHEHDPSIPGRLISCGQPVSGVRLQIHDEEGREVPAGQLGEICVQGRLVMEGYWKLPEATAEALRGGWLNTGDIGRQDQDGFVYMVDRSKDMVVSGGFNVYPREVEDVLMTHPRVRMAAVIGVPDDRWGEAVKALVVTSGDVDAQELIQLVREKKGPVYAPKSVEFLAEIPLTPLGKPDKKALRSRYWAGRDRLVH